MASPYYSSNGSSTIAASRGRANSDANSQAQRFDINRQPFPQSQNPPQETMMQGRRSDQLSRQGTGGPGNALRYYQHSQDAPIGGDAPDFGTGTDGFGGGDSYEERNGQRRQTPPYAQHYGQDYSQKGDSGQGNNRRYFQPNYYMPAYDDSPQPRRTSRAEDYKQYQNPAYSQQQLHQYPPQHSLPPSPARYDQQLYMGDIDRPDSPGFYPDRAPKLEKLNEAQRKIVKEFPEDLDEQNGSMLKAAVKNVRDWRTWVRWKFIPYYIIAILVILLIAFLTIYHHQIVDWLTPVSKKVRSVAWGFVIPVAILFIISFPPLFGHEIVGILLGVVYGLWIGFAILSLGTLLGEWGNFYAFKHFLKKHAARYERKSLNYACMAHIVREGGFLVVLLARLSAIPGHFTTAVFATVGMNFFIFTIATLLSMPKQLVVVYLGVAIEASGSGTESTRSKIIKYAVVLLSTLVTIGVAFYLYMQMHKARPVVQAQLQQKRYSMLSEAASMGTSPSDESMFAADESTAKLNEHGTYSIDDLQSYQVEQQKKTSRWKWGRKEKGETQMQVPTSASMESLSTGNDRSKRTVVIGDGLSMSLENSSGRRFSLGGEETLRGQNVQYVKASARSAQPSHQVQGQERGGRGFPNHSAPPLRDVNSYQTREVMTSPSTAPPFGPPSYHDGGLRYGHQNSGAEPDYYGPQATFDPHAR